MMKVVFAAVAAFSAEELALPATSTPYDAAAHSGHHEHYLWANGTYRFDPHINKTAPLYVN